MTVTLAILLFVLLSVPIAQMEGVPFIEWEMEEVIEEGFVVMDLNHAPSVPSIAPDYEWVEVIDEGHVDCVFSPIAPDHLIPTGGSKRGPSSHCSDDEDLSPPHKLQRRSLEQKDVSVPFLDMDMDMDMDMDPLPEPPCKVPRGSSDQKDIKHRIGANGAGSSAPKHQASQASASRTKTSEVCLSFLLSISTEKSTFASTLAELFFPLNPHKERKRRQNSRQTRRDQWKKLPKREKKMAKKNFQKAKAVALATQDVTASLSNRIERSTQTCDDAFVAALNALMCEANDADIVTKDNWVGLLVGIFAAMELEHSKVSGLVGEVSYAVRHIINLMALLANEYDFLVRTLSSFVVKED